MFPRLRENIAEAHSDSHDHRTLKNTMAGITVFNLLGVVGLGMNEVILWTFQAKLGIYYLFAKGVSGVAVFMWNFGARKIVLFR